MKVTKVEPIVLEAPVKEPWRVGMPPMKGGQVALPQKPGLGIEIDERAPAKFRAG